MTPADPTQDGIIEKTHRWLSRHGYPLELQTGRKLELAGFQVSHSIYYVDEATRKAREMDILAEYGPRKKRARPQDSAWS